MREAGEVESRERKRRVGGLRGEGGSIAEHADLILKWALIAIGLEQRWHDPHTFSNVPVMTG